MTVARTFYLMLLVSFLASPDLRTTGSEPVDRQIESELVESKITDYDRDHWAFQLIQRPKLPEVRQDEWPLTAIDYFILHELEAAAIKPAPVADSRALLRRLKYDLHGLPPTLAEQDRYRDLSNPQVYREAVDELLASPAYGERWAQFWLDLARYAETDGFEHDKTRKGAWRYRQWVIDALNRDMPYDQFVKLQILGDRTDDEDDSVATMFCLAGADMPDINEQDLRRHDKLNEITSTVGASLLGLQLQCAQCHDHKYDPISMGDFYRLRAVFDSAVPEMQNNQHYVQLETQDPPRTSWLYHRGELNGKGPKVDAGFPRIASIGERREEEAADSREALAAWLFSDSNTLTARVISNRIWQHHFGHSLTENPNDFGVIADGPTHPELLDWLATRLRDSNWSLKSLHRSILLSSTYQQSSFPKSSGEMAWQHRLSRDPANELYSRYPRWRIEGEAIRDSLLQVSGQLNRLPCEESAKPPLPTELTSTLLKGQWEVDPEQSRHYVRSVYIFARRNLRFPIFEAFDRPDAGATCGRRDRSTTAIQSLHLLNSELAMSAAKGLCARLLRQYSDVTEAPKAIGQLYEIALCRQPTAGERQSFMKVLDGKGDYATNLLTCCVAILNCNEFIYID